MIFIRIIDVLWGKAGNNVVMLQTLCLHSLENYDSFTFKLQCTSCLISDIMHLLPNWYTLYGFIHPIIKLSNHGKLTENV